MKNTIAFDPPRHLKMLCMLVLAFIPINMLFTPIFDYFTVEGRGTNWTVTISAFVFVLTLMPFLATALLLLKSHHEKRFLWGMIAFFLYAFVFTFFVADKLFYPMFGVASALGAALIGVLFYVSVRDRFISPKVVIYTLAFASVFAIMPYVLVQIDNDRFAQLAAGIGARNVLYGYENPRAVGWITTISLSLLAAYLSTQPQGNGIRPILLLLVTIAAAMLFWSGSRGGLVAFVASVLFVFLFSQTKNYIGLLSAAFCTAAGGAISSFLYLPSKAFGIFHRISQNLEQETVAAMTSGRSNIWQYTISYIAERPLTGYGYLPAKSLEGFSRGSAHNILLDYWLWFGLIIGSIVILLGLWLWAVAFTFFRKANNHYVSALFCVMTALMLYSMISGPYARTFPLVFFAVASGVILGMRTLKAR